jgi:hypothetical protein
MLGSMRPESKAALLAIITRNVYAFLDILKWNGSNTDVGSSDPAVEQAPEILHTVRVDSAVNVFDSMVNNLMLEFV